MVWIRQDRTRASWHLVLAISLPALRELLVRLVELQDNWSVEWKVSPCMPLLSDNQTVFKVAEDAEVLIDPCSDDADFDEQPLLLIHEIHDRLLLLRRRGVSLRTIHEALLQFQTPSRLLVTSDYRIILPDYGNLEIPLTPLPKALYLLYLRHPEGIAFKSLSDHRDELLHLYALLAPTINPSRRERHIQDLTDPSLNSLNEKVSLIRRAFSRHLDASLLPFYTITGEKGGVRTIRLAQGKSIKSNQESNTSVIILDII